jgi:hypothetical protein
MRATDIRKKVVQRYRIYVISSTIFPYDLWFVRQLYKRGFLCCVILCYNSRFVWFLRLLVRSVCLMLNFCLRNCDFTYKSTQIWVCRGNNTANIQQCDARLHFLVCQSVFRWNKFFIFHWSIPYFDVFFFSMAQQPLGGLGRLILRRFTITLRHTTLGRTPLDEGPARRRDLYLTTHNTHNRHPCPRRDSNYDVITR